MKILIQTAGDGVTQSRIQVVKIHDGGSLTLGYNQSIAVESFSDWLKLNNVTVNWEERRTKYRDEQRANHLAGKHLDPSVEETIDPPAEETIDPAAVALAAQQYRTITRLLYHEREAVTLREKCRQLAEELKGLVSA